jgi:protein associated with RNAse G/E
MKYDPRFKFVWVSNLEKINYFIENRKEEFSDKEVERIVDRLKGHVTK